MAKKHFFTIVVAVVIVAALLLKMFVFQVRQNEVAIRLTFGKPAKEPLQPGPHFRWPWPIQSVRKYDNRLHIFEGKQVQLNMKDNRQILATICVGWKIEDPNRFNENFSKFGDEAIDAAWSQLASIVRDKTDTTMQEYSIYPSLVSSNENELKHEVIENKAREAADAKARESFGIEIVLLKIKRLELPAGVRTAVYDRMRKERDTEALDVEKDGKTTAQNIKEAAISEAKQIESMAKRLAEDIRSEGDKLAALHYRHFEEDPELAIFLRKIQALKAVARSSTTIIMNTNVPPWDVLKIEPPMAEKAEK